MSDDSMYRFDDRDVKWQTFKGFEGLDYHLLSVDEEQGQVDMLMRFAPHQECVPHCHLGRTKTLVLEGEHRIYSHAEDGSREVSVRKAGTFSEHNGDETHTEGGGPDGAIILLMMTAVDGTVYDVLEEVGGKSVREISVNDFRRGIERQNAA